MTARAVALTGPPGSGKTAAGRLAAATLKADYLSAGQQFRDEAARRSMSLEQFSQYAAEHPEVDRALDARMVASAAPGRLLEGRLVGPMLRRARVPVLWIGLTARPEVRAARLAQRDGLPLAEARRAMEVRESGERDRYRRAYGIDLGQTRPDLTIDTSEIPAEEVARRIVQAVQRDRGDG
ncbi:MAG TPA: AAA family ATPase [Thermoplasmata archaeon]|nr:AAA family ATPase [Thermoplasmata archaeon]